MWIMGKGNGVHTIIPMGTRTRPAISSSRSQQISTEIKGGARITTVLAIQMPNAFIEEAENLRTVLLLMVKIVKTKNLNC